MMFITRKCTEPECRDRLYTKGMCKYHYDHNRYLKKIMARPLADVSLRNRMINGNWNTEQLSALEVAGNVGM